MSATRDKTQKITFVYSNFYELYRKGKHAALNADVAAPAAPVGLTTSQVLKAAEAPRASASAPAPEVREFRPTELLGRRLPAVRPVQSEPAPDSPEAAALRAKAVAELPVSSTGYEPILGRDAEALMSLRRNLDQLGQLHSRLRFMLQELEDLTKED